MDPTAKPNREKLEYIQERISSLLEHPLIAEIISQLGSGLSDRYTYHSAEHTIDVFTEVITFAALAERTEREIELLALAAAFHDAGFLVRPEENEEIAADMLVAAMREYGEYSIEEIEHSQTMVLDTKLVEADGIKEQRPRSELSRYLLDSDLSNFGRIDFFERLESLIIEKTLDPKVARIDALALMEKHTWFTPIARELRQAQKEENMRLLRQQIAAF